LPCFLFLDIFTIKCPHPEDHFLFLTIFMTVLGACPPAATGRVVELMRVEEVIEHRGGVFQKLIILGLGEVAQGFA
jgi:hypothetical protein